MSPRSDSCVPSLLLTPTLSQSGGLAKAKLGVRPLHVKVSIIVALLAFVALACSPSAVTVPGAPSDERSVTVTRVIDGDTVDVRRNNGTVDRVRLVGVDTPETSQSNKPGEYKGIADMACLDRWGSRATEYARDKLQGRLVRLDPDPKEGPQDAFGRLLAYVVVGEDDFNARLVELGYARVYTESKAEREPQYLVLQQRAQQGHLGLWGCSGSATTLGNGQPSAGATTGVVVAVLDLAGEVALIRNQGASPVDLTGWTMVSEVGGERFALPQLTLAPGASVEVVSGGGATHNPPVRLRWTDRNIWNNAGDSALLLDAEGRTVSRLDLR
ncbi:MAG: nuclease [Dehalococcoidia bacterium]|nr:nuclease [Dehalococcoidia bacterium]